MNKTSRNSLLLMLLFAFSFIYRVALMLRETFPPGADIGLHNSVIYSITQSGNTDFLWNYFHMGGGSSVTFPGYHIFTSYVVLLTGLPDYVAQALVVSLFSSLIVLVAFLLTRKVWGASAGLLVAFLVAVSRFDMEMLMWGGYPNVITLMLIPLAFYLFLEKDKFSLVPFLAVTSLVTGAIFLTHSLSSVMFIVITVATVFFGTLFAKHTGERRTSLFVWIVPLILGAIVIAPFLIQVAPAYLSSDASTFTGGVEAIRLALLSTKVLPLDLVIPLLACVFLFFLYSKRYIGKYVSVPIILLVLWTLIPAALTQGYLVGFYTDYNRFLYFVLLPIITLIGVSIFHGAEFFAQASDWLLQMAKNTPQVRMNKYKSVTRLMPHLTRKNLLVVFVSVFVVTAFLMVPVFVVPEKGIQVQEFYQLMNQPEYDAIEWAKQNTAQGSVFVTDAQYGWWLGGFSERPTISAVDPQYLTNSREFEPATAARYLLDTDYLVDNGLIQVREDGGYIGRHNPEFLAKLKDTYFPYPFFNFDNSLTEVSFRAGNETEQVLTVFLSTVPVADMHMDVVDKSSASIYVTQSNKYFNFTQITNIYQGLQFANMTIVVIANDPTVTFDHVRFTLPTKGSYFLAEDLKTVGQFDKYMKVAGQVIFTKAMPTCSDLNGYLLMDYNLATQTAAEMKFSVGVYPFEPNPELTLKSPAGEWTEYYRRLLVDFVGNYTVSQGDVPLEWEAFDYQQAIANHSVAYVVVRDVEQIPRFAKDPTFSLVFINNDVAIFQVRKDLS